MPEILSYARPGIKRRRRVPPDVLLGIAVGSITLVYNVGLASNLLSELRPSVHREFVYRVAVIEAIVSAILGATLIAGVIALTVRSSWALRFHRTYAWGKLGLAPVAIAIYAYFLRGHGWETSEVRWIMCILVLWGAAYPGFILLGLRRARMEKATLAPSA
jgi:hypothetical protein